MAKKPFVMTEVKIVPVKVRNNLVAYGSCVINGDFYLGNIAILVQSDGSYRLSFPCKKLKYGDEPLYNPINKKVFDYMTSVFNIEADRQLN